MAPTHSGASGRKKTPSGARSGAARARDDAGAPAVAKTTAKAPAKPGPPATARPPAGRPTARPTTKPAAKAGPKRAAARSATPPSAAEQVVATPPPAGPGPIERYQIALAAYTDCLRLLQERDWAKAAASFTDFIVRHGRERELADRARMYLSVCQQHIGDEGEGPKTFDERYAAAVILANRGEFDAALRLLDAALAERPESDKALYLKASTLAQQGQRRAALDLLTRAIARDEHNRVYALNDPDFGSLRDDEEFITLTTREDERGI